MGIIRIPFTNPKPFFVFSIVLLIHCSLHAQSDRVIIEREGQSFFVHTVEPGHTLYSISKLYQTEIETIEASNPEVTKGLQAGQTLYIPVSASHNPKVWTNPIRIEEGFMIHRVQKKETLYGICRDYTIEVNSLLELNPDAERGIQPGMELRIPRNDLHEPPTVTITKPEQETPIQDRRTESIVSGDTKNLATHTVASGETLYGICRRYNVDQQDLLDANNGLPAGLRAGDTIFIPTASPAQQQIVSGSLNTERSAVEARHTSLPKGTRGEFNIVLMLPLFLHEETPDKQANASTVRLRDIAMNFYRGALMAFQTLENQGAQLHVTLLDVHASSDLAGVLDHPAVRQSHLIIGPFQRKAIERIAPFAASNDIHMVCPVPQSNSILLKGATISKVHPSVDSQVKAMARHVFYHHQGENVLLINSKEISDVKAVETFKNTYLSKLRSSGDSLLTGFIEIEGSSKFVGDLQTRLSKARRNIIVVPAGNNSKSMIANLQTKLQLLGRDYDVIIYGMNDWLSYDFIDVSFKERTQLTVPSAVYTDYSSDEVVAFCADFRSQFGHDPSDFALLGHDIALFYGRALRLYGARFANQLDRVPSSGLLHLGFALRKTGIDSGYENEHVFMLQHHNYFIDPVSDARQN